MTPHQAFGFHLVMSTAGYDEFEAKVAAEQQAFFQDPGNQDYGRFQKFACLMGANVYRAAGRGDDFGCHLLDKLASAPWQPELEPYSDAVLKALGTFDKEASAITAGELAVLNGVKNMAGAAASSLPSAVTGATGLSLLAGGGLGTLAWLLNRDATADDSETNETLERARQYESLADRINQNLKTDATQESVAQAL